MTIQEAINKAIEGGYPKERVDDLSVHVQAQYLLESTFWEALVRALGVEGYFEFIHLDRDKPRTIRQPMWLYYWHHFLCIKGQACTSNAHLAWHSACTRDTAWHTPSLVKPESTNDRERECFKMRIILQEGEESIQVG